MTPAAGAQSGVVAGAGSAGGAGSVSDVLVCDLPMPASSGARPAAVAELRRLAPDIVVLHGGPGGLRWRSAAAGLARDAGLLHLDGGGGAGAPMLFVRMRVDTVTTWVRRGPGASRRSRGAVVGGVLRCSGQLFGVVGARYPAAPADPVQFGETVLAAVSKLREATERVVLAIGPADRSGVGDPGDGGSAARQLAAGGLVTSGGTAPSGLDGIWTTPAVRVVSAGAASEHQRWEHPPRLARLGVPSA